MHTYAQKFAMTWVICLVFASVAAPQASQSENFAERRAREFVRYLDSGNRAEFRKYVKENFAPSFLNIPMEQHWASSLRFMIPPWRRVSQFPGFKADRSHGVAEIKADRRLGGACCARRGGSAAQNLGTWVATSQASGRSPAAKKLGNEEMARELSAFVSKLARLMCFRALYCSLRMGCPSSKAHTERRTKTSMHLIGLIRSSISDQ